MTHNIKQISNEITTNKNRNSHVISHVTGKVVTGHVTGHVTHLQHAGSIIFDGASVLNTELREALTALPPLWRGGGEELPGEGDHTHRNTEGRGGGEDDYIGFTLSSVKIPVYKSVTILFET